MTEKIKVEVIVSHLQRGEDLYVRGDIIEVPLDFAMNSTSVRLIADAIASPVATMSIEELSSINKNVKNLITKFVELQKKTTELNIKVKKPDKATIAELKAKLKLQINQNKNLSGILEKKNKQLQAYAELEKAKSRK